MVKKTTGMLVDEMLRLSDEEILTNGLSKNDKWSENYQLLTNINVNKTLKELNCSIKKMNEDNTIMSSIMILISLIASLFGAQTFFRTINQSGLAWYDYIFSFVIILLSIILFIFGLILIFKKNK